MRPIEIIHSIERIHAARELQDHLKHDPHKTGGDLNMEEIKDTVELQKHSVQEAENTETLDPDAEGRGSFAENKEQEKKNEEENEEENSEKGDNPDNLGDHLDLMA